MAKVICEVSDGLRESEATVKLVTYNGRSEFLPVDRGFVITEGNRTYLSVGLVYTDTDKKAALISLPIEADSGAHQVWMKLDSLKAEQGIPA
jgi:hypothetical protein